ncbi:hypothetical protein EPR50_G00089360 [Perca flavescens]|uniref:Homeobox domain-containing protein n=1 Tax=Perca flavescens TaxID=8167 RepID=A0A484D347_PERFV|nr:hypothetical protein EPR50_G00089360 [Perca flavescens]
MLQTVSEWLWWERLWLPANVSWSDLEDSDGRVYAKASQLYAALPCALGLLLVRYLFERFLATPLANVWGVRNSVRLTAEPSPILENYFCSQARAPSQADVRSLCKKTSWPERRVQVWFKRRRNQERPGLRKRFCEARLIHCTWVYPVEKFSPFFGYYFFNVMLLVLQILHLYWAVLISRMVCKVIFSKLEGDDRSDEEENDSDSPEERYHKLSCTNSSGARGRANGH